MILTRERPSWRSLDTKQEEAEIDYKTHQKVMMALTLTLTLTHWKVRTALKGGCGGPRLGGLLHHTGQEPSLSGALHTPTGTLYHAGSPSLSPRAPQAPGSPPTALSCK